jgi:hypothetical protein
VILETVYVAGAVAPVFTTETVVAFELDAESPWPLASVPSAATSAPSALTVGSRAVKAFSSVVLVVCSFCRLVTGISAICTAR